MGTCYYVAPEVIRRQYDEKADIWSCGVILYILFCGYPPFNGDTEIEIFKTILKQELIFDEDDWVNIDQDAKDLILNMLKKMPIERYSIKDVVKHKWFNKFRTESSYYNK